MPIVSIDDLDDPRIAVYRHLKATNLTRDAGQFVVEGERLFESLRASRFPLASVLVLDRHLARIAPRVPEDVPLFVLSAERISQLIGFSFHQGVVASGYRRDWPTIERLIEPRDRPRTLVVCPRVDNPENLGAIIRLGDVFGIDAVIVGPRAPDPLSRRVLRVSMGTSLTVPVIASEQLESVVARLGDAWGFQRVATVTDVDAEPLPTFRASNRLALFFGCEGTGLEPEWIARCDRRLTIPMRTGGDSLNVAVAAGIVLYELTRERIGMRSTTDHREPMVNEKG